MAICTECLNHIIRAESEVIYCSKCNSFAHLACVNINLSKKQFDKLKKGTDSFICYKCKNLKSDTSSQQKESSSVSTAKLFRGTSLSDINNPTTVTTLSPAFTEAIQIAVSQRQRQVGEEFQDKLFSMLKNFQSKQDSFNQTLNETVLSLKQEIINNANRIYFLEDNTSKQADVLNDLKVENRRLREKSESLQRDLIFQEQLSLQNTLKKT